jgi:hypothetical protein
MKVIITESRINKIMFDYLDSTEYETIDDFDNSTSLLLRKDSDDSHDFYYKYFNKELYVDDELASSFASLFSLDLYDALDFIGKWFEDRHNVDVKYTINWT